MFGSVPESPGCGKRVRVYLQLENTTSPITRLKTILSLLKNEQEMRRFFLRSRDFSQRPFHSSEVSISAHTAHLALAFKFYLFVISRIKHALHLQWIAV